MRLFGRRDPGAATGPAAVPHDEKRRIERETAYWLERAEAARERALLQTRDEG